MPRPTLEQIAEFEKKGSRPFIIIFRWPSTEDAMAVKKMSQFHETLGEKGVQGGHGWYLTGKRTMLVIGWSDSNIKLQALCSAVTYGVEISADVCFAVDIHELASLFARDA